MSIATWAVGAVVWTVASNATSWAIAHWRGERKGYEKGFDDGRLRERLASRPMPPDPFQGA